MQCTEWLPWRTRAAVVPAGLAVLWSLRAKEMSLHLALCPEVSILCLLWPALDRTTRNPCSLSGSDQATVRGLARLILSSEFMVFNSEFSVRV